MESKNEELSFSAQTAKIAFDISKSEYENEKKRNNDIDFKTSIIGALAVILIGLFPNCNVFDFFAPSYYCENTISKILSVFFYLATVLFAVFTFISLFRTLSKRSHPVLDTSFLLDPSNMIYNETDYCISCSYLYDKAINDERKENDKKVRCYQHSLAFLFISIITSIFYKVLVC